MREVIRTISLIFVAFFSLPAIVNADPTWEYIYEGDILPDDPSLGSEAWQLMGDNQFAEVTAKGELYINDIGQNHCFFLYNVEDAAMMEQATIEARVKVLSKSGSANFEVLVGMQDGSNSKWLDLFPDHILLDSSTSTYDVDMTEYHILRMVRDSANIRIYVDDEEVMNQDHVGAGESWIGFIFGAGCTACRSEQYWDYVVFTTEGGYSPYELASYAFIRGEEGVAYGPNPADDSLHADTWVNLSWRPGPFAVSHDVYLGDDFDVLVKATRDSDVFRGSQTDTFYVAGFPGFAYPDGLVPGTTYYWRIDEVNDAEPNSPWVGPVWSFSIPPKTAYNPDPADGAESVAVDSILSWTPGFGAKLHTVYIGTAYDTVNNAAGSLPQGTASYNPAAPLELEKVYYWRVDEFDAVTTYKGDIWGFTTPGAAGSPIPANGAAGVSMTAQLSWTPATTAVSHDVYLGADKDAVMNATTVSPEYKGNKASGSESLDPGKLAWHSDYYWRVDAVYSIGTVKGLVWSFTTADFISVDDFESYNDIDPPDLASNRIFDNWIDGFGTTDNGALVGNDLPPYAEQTVVHSGIQSMPYFYDNNLKTSEATLTLVSPRDWTEEGVGKLSLWLRGASANAADRIYVALNGTAVVYNDNPAATQTSGWTEWIIDLQAFADQGVNLTNVNTITIGIGTKDSPAAGSTGRMCFDDIRLERS